MKLRQSRHVDFAEVRNSNTNIAIRFDRRRLRRWPRLRSNRIRRRYAPVAPTAGFAAVREKSRRVCPHPRTADTPLHSLTDLRSSPVPSKGGYWCGCWLFGDTSEKLDRAAGDPNAGCCGSCLLFWLSHLLCLQGFVGCCERSKLRSQFNLEGEDCPACWCVLTRPTCARTP